jgi:hypothetical protein
MSRRKVNLIILCEDIQQSAFARRYLAKRGFAQNRIRVRQCPSGSGAGEQFVRRQLIQEVKEHRRKSSYQREIALVIIIDADTSSVEERLRQINDGLEQAGLEKIGPDEQIAVFIPKRNIETWIRFATDQDVNEDIPYPKLRKARSCKHEVDLYVNRVCRNGIPENAPSSLVHACEELRKII